MAGLGFNSTLFYQQPQQAAAAEQEARYPSAMSLQNALKKKYTLPKYIRLAPFVSGDKDLKDSVIDTQEWNIYEPSQYDPNKYIQLYTTGFYSIPQYYTDLYDNLLTKMEPAPELEYGGRRHKRAQAKSSKKRINRNKRHTRSRR
jgi:hypothetical protein